MTERLAGYGIRERGQSLVETLVLAIALLPLLLAVPLLAKYQDIRHAAIAASRTAAFECTVRFERCAEQSVQGSLAGDLRRRHFARHDRDLLSQDALEDAAPADQRNRFWVDRRGQPLLGNFSDVSLRIGAGESDAARGAWGEGAGAGPESFGLGLGAGLIDATVSARVSAGRTVAQWLRRPEGIALSLTGRTAIMVDTWNASRARGGDPRTFESRVDRGRRLPSVGGVDPEGAIDLAYAPIRELITGPLLAPVEPRGHLFRYHEIDVELVPEDRLVQP